MSATPPFPGFDPCGETLHMDLLADPRRRVLYAVRKQGVPMPADEVEAAHRLLFERPDHEPGWGLIVDTRPVTGNNDPRFEAAISRANAALIENFARIAVLVRSAIGRLHAERLRATETIYVTDEPHDALSFVLGEHAARL